MRTDGSANILAFVQSTHDISEVRYVTTIKDVDTTQGTTSTTRTLSLPPHSLALFRMNMGGAGSAELIVRPLTETDAAPLVNAVPGASLILSGPGDIAAEFEVELNASSQLATRMNNEATVNLRIHTKGCRFLAPIVP